MVRRQKNCGQRKTMDRKPMDKLERKTMHRKTMDKLEGKTHDAGEKRWTEKNDGQTREKNDGQRKTMDKRESSMGRELKLSLRASRSQQHTQRPETQHPSKTMSIIRALLAAGIVLGLSTQPTAGMFLVKRGYFFFCK